MEIFSKILLALAVATVIVLVICVVMYLIHILVLGMLWLRLHNLVAMFSFLAVSMLVITFFILNEIR